MNKAFTYSAILIVSLFFVLVMINDLKNTSRIKGVSYPLHIGLDIFSLIVFATIFINFAIKLYKLK